MKYVLTSDTNTLIADINTQWDNTHFCKPSRLTQSEREQFGVLEVHDTAKPVFDDFSQSCTFGGCANIDGIWTTQWVVNSLPSTSIDEKLQEIEAERIAQLWQGAHGYEYKEISGSAVGLLAIGVMQGLPKCLAVQAWIKSIWTEYYTRKAGTSTDYDYSICGVCPHSVPELMAELGL